MEKYAILDDKTNKKQASCDHYKYRVIKFLLNHDIAFYWAVTYSTCHYKSWKLWKWLLKNKGKTTIKNHELHKKVLY